jgi:hypothetical protein
VVAQCELALSAHSLLMCGAHTQVSVNGWLNYTSRFVQNQVRASGASCLVPIALVPS